MPSNWLKLVQNYFQLQTVPKKRPPCRYDAISEVSRHNNNYNKKKNINNTTQTFKKTTIILIMNTQRDNSIKTGHKRTHSDTSIEYSPNSKSPNEKERRVESLTKKN